MWLILQTTGCFLWGELLNRLTCMLHNKWINDFLRGKNKVTRVTKELN